MAKPIVPVDLMSFLLVMQLALYLADKLYIIISQLVEYVIISPLLLSGLDL